MEVLNGTILLHPCMGQENVVGFSFFTCGANEESLGLSSIRGVFNGRSSAASRRLASSVKIPI